MQAWLSPPPGSALATAYAFPGATVAQGRQPPRPLDYYDCRVASQGDPSRAAQCAQVDRYLLSGDYDKDLEEIARRVAETLGYAQTSPYRAAVLAARGDERVPVVIFDIDDTLISTSPARFKKWFEGQPPAVRATIPEGFLPPLDPMIALYRVLRERLGYKVILLTGRYDVYRNSTIENLRRLGITGYDHLILRDPQEYGMSASDYKTRRRTELDKSGYDVVASIGDQMSDITGPYTGLAIKLPNPMYSIH